MDTNRRNSEHDIDRGLYACCQSAGIYPDMYSPSTVSTWTFTSRQFRQGLLSIVAGTSLAVGADQDATAGEIVSAALWDTAKARDPLFVTDVIEYVTDLHEYEHTTTVTPHP